MHEQLRDFPHSFPDLPVPAQAFGFHDFSVNEFHDFFRGRKKLGIVRGEVEDVFHQCFEIALRCHGLRIAKGGNKQQIESIL